MADGLALVARLLPHARLDSEGVPVVANYIGGKWVPPTSCMSLADLGPATTSVIARIPRSDKADVDLAVAAAAKAQRTSECAHPSYDVLNGVDGVPLFEPIRVAPRV